MIAQKTATETKTLDMMLRFGPTSQIARRLNLSAFQQTRCYCATRHLELAEKKKSVAAPKKKKVPIAEKTSLNKMDLVASIAETHELTTAESKRILSTVLNTITGAVADNKSVTLIGLGSFRKMKTKSRNVTVPSTGRSMVVPEGYRVQFRASKVWRQLLK